MIVIQDHILTDEKAAAYIDGWIDGQYTRGQGLPRMAPNSIFSEHDQGFYDGYDAPNPTLPAMVSEHD